LDWIFLSNCQQKVFVRGLTSSWSPVFHGVPQGSVLGWIIYNLHDWLPEVVKSNLWESVDDLLLYIVNDWLDISTDWLKWLYGLLGNHQWILTNANIWLWVEIQIDNIQCSSDNSIIQQCIEESDLGVIFTVDLVTCTFIVQYVKHPKRLESSTVHFMCSPHILCVYCTHHL